MSQPQTATQPTHRIPFLVPTFVKQSWSFMIGSALFAVGSAMGVWGFGTSDLSNWLCFVGAWFFTTAGLFQLILSGDATVPVSYAPGKMFRAEWLAASTQSFGTIMFNVSTTAALTAGSVTSEKHFVWNPDAGGSVAFLISATFVYVAYYRQQHSLWQPRRTDWWSAHFNMVGCIAFGVSAVGAFILDSGALKDSNLANWGTFIGAVCFFLANLVTLPALQRKNDNSSV